MSKITAFRAARIFNGSDWHFDAALLVENGIVIGVVEAVKIPADAERIDAGEILAPGFVDLQVNGGGGVMLNDHPHADTIETICRAHTPFGTTSLLATLITDTPDVTAAAIAAGAEAARRKIPGFLGLHLEGPHLSVTRKGAHDPKLIRPMTAEDEAALIAARQQVPVLLTTVAVESVYPMRIAALSRAGIIVSLGHSDARYADAVAAATAGASMVTHLFNAMSPIGNREPGLAGAALDLGGLNAGLIADRIHVDPATMRLALRGKAAPGTIFLVTDAMATIGTGMTSFKLNGRTIHRGDGRLTLADGTLAGADLDMISAVRNVHYHCGVDLGEALRMASTYPAAAVGQSHVGRLAKGCDADMVALSDSLRVLRVWRGGQEVFTT